jgi:H+/Cl- antiporter ClcA
MIRALRSLSAITARRTRGLWRRYGIFWLGAILVGLVAVYYARLIDWGFALFSAARSEHPWLPLAITPAAAALCVFVTRRFFRGSEGSGLRSSPYCMGRQRRRARDCSPCAFSSRRSPCRSSR